MTTVGLPTVLEVTIGALLQNSHLTSWKVCGEGTTNTVVVIRFKNDPETDNNMASCQQASVSSGQQHYRKKNPSQVRRDRKRAEDRIRAARNKEQDEKASENLDVIEQSLFMPAPPTLRTLSNNTEPTYNDTPLRVHAREFRSTLCEIDLTGAETCEDQCTDVGLLEKEHTTETEYDAALDNIRAAGYSVDIIKHYVGDLTDKSLQRKLRNASRNLQFCNQFASEDNQNSLVCESDDVVFQFNWTSADANPTHFFWFAKREIGQMTQKERAIYSKMQFWTPADKDRMKDRIDAGLRALHIIIDGVRFFLG